MPENHHQYGSPQMAYQNLTTGQRSEQRRADRLPMKTDGRIVMASGFKLPFNVIDISPRGAKIKLTQYVVMPDTFVIEIFSPDRTKLKRANAHRQWQRNSDVGVRFKDAVTESLV